MLLAKSVCTIFEKTARWGTTSGHFSSEVNSMAMSDAERQAKRAERKKAAGIADKVIQVKMHATCPVEMQIFESWRNEPEKKMLFIKLYTDHLAKKPSH